MRIWLRDLGLEQYVETFAENHITDSLLGDLTSDDLKELGISSLGHRKILLAAIAAHQGTDNRRAANVPRAVNANTAVAAVAAPASDTHAAEAHRHEPPGTGERRQVTILFADLCGFTALSKTLDAEELHALVGRYTSLVDGIVKSYGGTVDKHIGDAVMALFGAPIAHGDDPLRAGQAALDIHLAVTNLGLELGRKLQAHLGIASGEVIAGDLGHPDRADYSVLGDSVNLASRLVTVAQAGQTVISDAVHRALAGRDQCDALGEVQVRGLDQPLRLWRLRSLVTEPGITTLFVGRQAELAHFTGIANSCLADKHGQALLIRGEAGIGKTRLVAEMTAIATRLGFTHHRGLVFDFGGGRGQDPIRTVIRSLLSAGTAGVAPGPAMAVPESPVPESPVPESPGQIIEAQVNPAQAMDAQRLAVEQAIATGLLSRNRQVFLHDLLDLPKTMEMLALYDAMDNNARQRGRRDTLMSITTAVARRQPILLIFEDLHWADAAILSAVAAMAMAIRPVPAILLMTSRVDGDQLDTAWRAGIRGTPLATIDLGPLQEAEAMALASGFIDATQRTAMSCVKRAEGNPLFLEQLLHNAEEGADEQVPGSIQSLILARLDRLTARDKQAAQVASVIGQQFDLAGLRDLLDDPDYTCAGLIEHAVVRPDGNGYLFAHALIQQGVYSSLLRAHRRSLHQRAAQRFAAADPVLRAQHLDRAEDPAAPGAYATAAISLHAAYHFDQALAAIERGLGIARETSDAHALIYLKGETMRDLGDIPAAIATYRQALEIAPDDIARCRDWIGLATVLRVSEGLQEALELLDQAEAVAMAHDLVPELARLHHLRGNIYFPMGRIDACRRAHEVGLRYAQQSRSTEAEARSLGGLGDAAYAQGRMRAARDYFSRCVDLSHQHGFGRIEVANRSMVGFSRFYLTEIAEALQDGIAATETAGRVGHFRAELLGEAMCVMAAIELGELDLASRHLPRAEELATWLGAHRFEAQNLEFTGRILLGRGDRSAAAAKLRDAVSMCRQVGLQFSGPKTLSILAVATDDVAERQAVLEEGVALLKLGAVGHNHLWFYRDAMEAMILARDWAGLLVYADALANYTGEEPLPWSDLFIRRARATAALGQGGNAHTTPDVLAPRDVPAPCDVLAEVRASFAAAAMKPYVTAIDRELGAL